MARTAKLSADGTTLFITQDGDTDEYVLERLDPDPSVAKLAIRLKKIARDGSSFSIYDVSLRSWGWECDCPDFHYRKDGTGVPCKHIGAMIAKGVIKP